ncbi:MAG: L-rhamnonate dehydratase [Actinomycetota bacterium]
MVAPHVAALRAFVPEPSADDPLHQPGNWLTESKIANPMSHWVEFRASRASWGLGAIGPVLVEVETSDGHVGVAPSVGGIPAAYIAERHLSRFVEGKPLSIEGIAEAWEQMFRASLYYGRRGLTLHAISAVDLALWDALGRSRGQPVWSLLGRKVADAVPVYATTPRPDIARQLGFVGGKLPLPAGPADGAEGFKDNVAVAERMRARCGDPEDFFLAVDCYMALDVAYAADLIEALAPLEYRWLEEALPPDDYWGYAEIRRLARGKILAATGEHEATRWGFRLLLEMGCADIIQPDVLWCGGLTELTRIADIASEHKAVLVPHASSVYAYHFLASRPEPSLAEFVMVQPTGNEIVPVLAPLLVNEPLPERGYVHVGDEPGFGVEENPDIALLRPYPH